MPATSYLLRLSEAAELLGLTPGPARRWLTENKVPCIDYGPGLPCSSHQEAAHA